MERHTRRELGEKLIGIGSKSYTDQAVIPPESLLAGSSAIEPVSLIKSTAAGASIGAGIGAGISANSVMDKNDRSIDKAKRITIGTLIGILTGAYLGYAGNYHFQKINNFLKNRNSDVESSS